MRNPNLSEHSLLTEAQRGDRHAFDELTAPYRAELLVHCYRLLGSLHDAEDLVQETFLRAWRQLANFQPPFSFRAWLYKIATNLSLNMLARLRRRTTVAVATASEEGPLRSPAPIVEPIWLEPFPDDLLADLKSDPEAVYSQRESVRLAFLVALQVLPARQRATLILHDVLDWQAQEIAELLAMTVSAVNSALHRARATLAKHYHAQAAEVIPLSPDAPMRHLLNRYIHAWEEANVAELVAILKEDAAFFMPPLAAWYQGREAIGAFVAQHLFAGAGAGHGRVLPVAANAQPAFALYRRDSNSSGYRAYGISVLTVEGEAIATLSTFLDVALFPRFNMPAALPG